MWRNFWCQFWVLNLGVAIAQQNAVEERNNTKLKYLDVSRLTELRGDVHSHPDKDCLHTCIPGKQRATWS
jgi:hypothetical protein